MDLMLALLMVVFASVVIMYACDSFEDASDFLGRNMAPGVKGGTINAIGSSLPELFTTIALLFFFHDQGGFSAGIATTAGSAVFNSVIIPMVCILVVRYKGVVVDRTVDRAKRKYEIVREIEIDKVNVLRDAVFLLMAEAVLIIFLGGSTMAWWMGGALMLIYAGYFFFLAKGFGSGADEEDEDDDDEDDEDEDSPSKIRALLTFDFNTLFFNGKPLTDSSAWVILGCSVVVVAAACHLLAEAVIMSAEALNVPAYFTAVILAAAASSVPDTILSVKDAMKGDYDDAVSNALGSNIFDITVALGLPLLVYGMIFGDVSLLGVDQAGSQIQVLRIVLFATTIAVLAAFLLQKRLTVGTAYFFGALYTGWLGYIVFEAGRVAAWW